MDSNLRDGVLVLGSTGFIGAHLVERLDRHGYTVYALARSEQNITRGRIRHVSGSMDDAELLRGLISRCRHIVHVAGLTTPSTSATAPAVEISGNLGALARLLSFANEFPDRRLVYMSSAGAVYGDHSINIDEGALLRPRSYYGAGKAAAEAFIHACSSTTSWQCVVLRPSNIYGPGQSPGKGFAIVPTLFTCAADNTTFNIWGDGGNVRDYCHVSDLVDLAVRAVGFDGGPKSAIYNAASGEAVSIVELISACERSTGRKINVKFLPSRSVDVPHVSLDTKAARSAYDWEARISLNEGLDMTWEWFQGLRVLEQTTN
ncbi:NAD-dependent epimerase/dehydratase family protein [Lysobacter cavernae]|uniref:UDP-glucose 4-epimerase n=1 Tax=Lysobacter cavernae TaxID=1685901 RepID=A0ABV7RNN0_9GAMM